MSSAEPGRNMMHHVQGLQLSMYIVCSDNSCQQSAFLVLRFLPYKPCIAGMVNATKQSIIWKASSGWDTTIG